MTVRRGIHPKCHALPVVALGVTRAFCLPAAPARAEFGPPITLSAASENAVAPYVGIDADGDAVVVWRREVAGITRVQVRARSAAGALGPIQTVSGASEGASEARIAVDAGGDSLIAWINGDGRVRARARTAAGVLGPLQTVSSRGQYLHVAMNAGGDALIVWHNPVTGRVQARARSAAGAFAPVQTVSGPNAVAGGIGWPEGGLHAAIDADGDALIVWRGHPDGYGAVQARRRSAAGVLGPVRTLSSLDIGANGTLSPKVAANATGSTLVVWTRFDGSRWQIESRTASTGSDGYGPVRLLSNPARHGYDPRPAINENGDGMVVWHDGTDHRVRARTFLGGGGSFGPVQLVSGAGPYNITGGQNVGVDAEGDAVVTWNFDAERIRVRPFSAPDTFGAIQAISNPGAHPTAPQIAMSPAGHALAVWQRSSGGYERVQAAAGP